MSFSVRIVVFTLFLIFVVNSQDDDIYLNNADETDFDSTSITEFDSDKHSEDSVQIESSEGETGIQESQTCSELYDELKKSDCGRTIFKYIKGASVKIGLTLNTSSLDIKSNDTLYARLVGLLSPAPYYALSFRPRYFGHTYLGWQVALVYTSSSTVDQVIKRGNTSKNIDLHTLSIFNLAAITPSLFLDMIGSKKDASTFLRLGVGVGLGWSSVRGVAYFTENTGVENGFCYDASTSRLEGTVENEAIEDNCDLQHFRYSSVGVSVRAFLDGRFRWFYGAFEVDGVGLRTQEYSLSPSNVKLKLAYLLDI